MAATTALSANPFCREHLAGRAQIEKPERVDFEGDALGNGGFSPRRHVDLYRNQRGV